MSAAFKSPPALLVVLEVEAEPFVLIDAVDESEELRLHDWIDARPDLRALVEWVERLVEVRAAR